MLVDDRTTSPETTAIWLWTTEAIPPDTLIHKLLEELTTFRPAFFPNEPYADKLFYYRRTIPPLQRWERDLGLSNYYRLQAEEGGPRFTGGPVAPPDDDDEHETVLMINWWHDDQWSSSKGWQDRKWTPKQQTWESSSWTEAPQQGYDAVYDAIETGDMEEVQAACGSTQVDRGRRLSRGRGGKSRGKEKRQGKSSAASSSAEMRGDAPQPAPKRSAEEQKKAKPTTKIIDKNSRG